MPGDLGGFVAATYLRGMAFVQVPTSMAAMVDASIGGKVAINLPQAKNLVGAFYQPRGVFADASALSTLGKRELAEGWAEAIKHGFILDAELVDVFEEHAEALMDVDPEISADVIRRSMAIKAEVVSQDERETLGIRILLNYGHTIGHALEASTEYGRFLHGEGVSVGMMGAARMAAEMGLMSPAIVDRQQRLLERFSLPISAPGVPAEDVLTAMSLDKKVQSGTNRWVMLEDVGRSVVRQDVPWELVGAHGAGPDGVRVIRCRQLPQGGRKWMTWHRWSLSSATQSQLQIIVVSHGYFWSGLEVSWQRETCIRLPKKVGERRRGWQKRWRKHTAGNTTGTMSFSK